MKSLLFSCLILFATLHANAQSELSNPGKFAALPATNEAVTLSNAEDMHALVLCSGSGCDSFMNAAGIIVNARFGEIRSVQFAPDKLTLLRKMPCILYIEAATRANAARFKSDVERQTTSVDKVQSGLANSLPQNYKGKGVIVGIVDIGFQCNNPTFYNSDGSKTRIVRYWQQSNKTGPAPSGFGYGTEITDTALIQAANDMDGTHGTHVAGIAAGSGFSTPGLQYRGVAPEADLVFVSIKYSNDTLGGSALGDYIVANPTILDAYTYIFNYAASVGKPAVINLSWGMHTGPHDGSSLFDKACESLVGPGRILVGANGNEGDNAMHWEHRFNKDTASSIMIENGRQWRKRESVYGDFWGSPQSEFSAQIRFIDTNKQLICETPFISSVSDTVSAFSFNTDSAVFRVAFACEAQSPLNRKPNITIMADHQNQRKYAIVVRITSDSALVHGWNSGAVREWTSGAFVNRLNQIDYSNTFIAGNTDYTAGENGGTSKAVISVGALAARSAYRNVKGVWVNDSGYVVPVNIAKFSSKGPTTDGRIKPDISAPGYDVPSAVNNKQFAAWMLDRTLLKTVFRNDTQYWTAFSGTSMAAPHVTGIVAMLLQVNPSLSAEQMKAILSTTATADQNTGTVPNMQYGYGKVNAYAAVVNALQFSGLSLLKSGTGIHLYPNPADAFVYCSLPDLMPDAALEILSSDGSVVLKLEAASLGSGLNTLDISALSSGIYLLRFANGGEIFTGKLIKN